MAGRLVDSGYAVQVWNRTRSKADAVVARGATWTATPAAAATGASAVLIAVADDEALDQILDGPNGVLAGLARGAVVVALGTVAAATARRAAAAVDRAGGRFLDVGLLGNARHAIQGELRLYVGGAPADVATCRPLFEDLAKEIVHVGDIGSGMQLKLVLNQVMGLEMQALAEAVALGTALGLDRRLVLGTIAESGFASPVMSFKARRMADERYDLADFRLSLMAKDLDLAAAAAAEADIVLPASSAAADDHRAAVAAGLGDLDCSAIAAYGRSA
jgi:3-hydroxyisobutyrate dehydrogenase